MQDNDANTQLCKFIPSDFFACFTRYPLAYQKSHKPKIMHAVREKHGSFWKQLFPEDT